MIFSSREGSTKGAFREHQTVPAKEFALPSWDTSVHGLYTGDYSDASFPLAQRGVHRAGHLSARYGHTPTTKYPVDGHATTNCR